MAEVLDEVERDRRDGSDVHRGRVQRGFSVLLVVIMLWLSVGS